MPPTPRPAFALALLLAALPATAHAQYGGGGIGTAQDEIPVVPGPADSSVTPAAAQLWIALGKPVSMPFAHETPLEDVVKYIQSATQGPDLPGGIPIYVDPVGLMEAEKTLQSPVVLNLEGLPLTTTLRLLLRQLDLGYRLEPEGYLLITSRNALRDPGSARDDAIARELAALRQEVAQLRALVAQQSSPPGASTARGDRQNARPGGPFR
jgi:hypothetical protein